MFANQTQAAQFLHAEGFLKKPCRQTVARWVEKGWIHCFRNGEKVCRFDLDRLKAELLSREIRPISKVHTSSELVGIYSTKQHRGISCA